ncbi:hypothetical protein [Actinacidiphila paucisporea]|uniref:hypothetical protein n=1 Tax=Actinacidiphila paucisporea TaxID=310782 RepID=UPI001161220D|nr:hypothetical protein [Actinacidiphila paucisporea]
MAWAVKKATYAAAAHLPALQPALLKALLGSYNDVYGKTEPAAALALLEQLDLPADIDYLEELRAVLSAGHPSHYCSPQAWTEALQARP